MKLYPWSLAQLRMPHQVDEPSFPKIAPPYRYENRGYIGYIVSLVTAFEEQTQGSMLAWQMSALVILELVVDAFTLLPELTPEDLEGRRHVAELANSLKIFNEYMHGEVPYTSLNPIMNRLTNIYRHRYPQPLGGLWEAAYEAALLFDPDEAPWRRVVVSLDALQSIVNIYIDRAAVAELFHLWWNRTFARLAFIQEEEE